ncbi:4Fe-4S double cluster binding domain-containing protein [Candidatus Bipolaricaulota bacterium]
MVQRAPTKIDLAGHPIVYNYATISIDHIDELQGFIDQLDQDGKLSDQKTYREYITSARYALPDDFPEAKSIIVFALYVKLMKATFHLDGEEHDVLVPPQYYRLGLPPDATATIVTNEILPSSEYRLERLPHGHLKLLAVRSGLARYGRNNITYVDGMGSFLAHVAFVTDCEFPDEWTDLGMMSQCDTCRVCLESCPTGAIRQHEFVIDAGKCIPLYNEVPGDFPDWLPADVHNATIGCMRCQLPCPANREAVADAGRLPDITEQETRVILGELADDEVLKSAGEKLRIDLTEEETFQTISRNMRAVLRGR